MRYVYVLSSVKPYSKTIDIVPSILRHTSDVLLSLKEMFGKKVAGENKVKDFSSEITSLIGRYRRFGIRLWIDSGGYSFINGDIDPDSSDSMIDMYNMLLEQFPPDVHRIFSLDLPFSKKYHDFNRPENIYKANKTSVSASVEVLKRVPSLCDKFVFVMHSRTAELYTIWSKIYKELDAGKYIQHRAIGGLVGVRAGTKNVMSPFVAAAYKAFVDFLNAKGEGEQRIFSLHFLGVNAPQDRFLIAALEELFLSYDYLGVCGVDFSYDNSRFGEKARKGNKTIDAYILGKRIGLYAVPGYNNISPSSIEHIYDIEVLDAAMASLVDFNQEKKVFSTEVFEPINVHSQTEIDKIFSKTVKKYKLVEVFYSCKTEKQFEKCVDAFLSSIAHDSIACPEHSSDPDVLVEATLFDNDNLKICTKKNLLYVFKLHRWFIDARPPFAAIGIKSRKFIDDWERDRESNLTGLSPKKST